MRTRCNVVEVALRSLSSSRLPHRTDRNGLENVVSTMNSHPEEILCVHGDESATDELSSGLYQEFDLQTYSPRNLESFRFDWYAAFSILFHGASPFELSFSEGIERTCLPVGSPPLWERPSMTLL